MNWISSFHVQLIGNIPVRLDNQHTCLIDKGKARCYYSIA